MIDIEDEGYNTPLDTVSPTRQTPKIDLVQQEIYAYMKSLEQRAQ